MENNTPKSTTITRQWWVWLLIVINALILMQVIPMPMNTMFFDIAFIYALYTKKKIFTSLLASYMVIITAMMSYVIVVTYFGDIKNVEHSISDINFALMQILLLLIWLAPFATLYWYFTYKKTNEFIH